MPARRRADRRIVGEECAHIRAAVPLKALVYNCETAQRAARYIRSIYIWVVCGVGWNEYQIVKLEGDNVSSHQFKTLFLISALEEGVAI